ncbi:MAG: DNA translocase FtsK 4TM domain-containing protein [Neisseriaceae bacterium]|nr:DNA translocase FtsK 4TM domain-containing protein [Neisseriaceae bacterium]
MAEKTANKKSRKTVTHKRPPKRAVVKNDDLPNPITAVLVGDTLWLVSLVLTGYIVLCLLSFTTGDVAWSHSTSTNEVVRNLGGRIGAYVADIAYYLCGFSFWWVIFAAGVWLFKSFRARNVRKNKGRYLRWVGIGGLLLLIAASTVIEHSVWAGSLKGSLPADAGGLLGRALTPKIMLLFGTSGSTIAMVAAMLIGASLILQVSWLEILELVGKLLERLYHLIAEKPVALLKKRQEEDDDGEKISKKAKEINQKPMEIQQASVIRGRELEAARVRQQDKRRIKKMAQQESGLLFEEEDDVGDNPLPSVNLLKPVPEQKYEVDEKTLNTNASHIETKLSEFGIGVKVVKATAGPVITRYEIEPAQGVKGSQIVGLGKDLARSLSLQSVRIVETIEGKNTMGIELPNEQRQMVSLREIFEDDVFQKSTPKLTVALGKDIAGTPVVANLAKMPHLLVAGTTGSGKSVGVNAMIVSMLYKATPDEVRFIMIDPKMLELSVYQDIPHLLCPVVTDMKLAANALAWSVAEMDKRYKLLAHVGVRNIEGFNAKITEAIEKKQNIPNPFSLDPDNPEPLEKLPFIVVVVDEFADLMMTGDKKKVEEYIVRLAQKARAAGIHLILATQRPSVDVITGLIKANIPTRIAFQVSSKVDSRTVLDQMGAENLLGQGDMLFLPPGNAYPQRIHGAFLSDDEVLEVVAWIKRHSAPNYIDGILDGGMGSDNGGFGGVSGSDNQDELFDQAVKFVLETRKTSISSLQRHLRVGYNRAANLIEAMEQAGILSPAELGGARKILKK